jgi:hypothetical protein
MIVNFQDSNSFLEKRSNGLGSFDEVIVHYRARSDYGKSAFHFLRFEENKIPSLNFFRNVDPLKILSYFSRENVYLLKKYNSKNQIAQLLFFCRVLINTGQDELLNFN